MEQLLAGDETLTIESRVIAKRCRMIAAVVVLANTEGGVLLLGAEDNGEDPGFYDIRPT